MAGRMTDRGGIAVFAPDPLLVVAIERGPGGGDEMHVHAAGQGVWAARMVEELGGDAVLCCFSGGETGDVLEGLLRGVTKRFVPSSQPNGSYVVDRRSGREVLAQAFTGPRGRHEIDELLSVATTAALSAGVLVVCNPFPAETFPAEQYAQLVADVREAGTQVLVDLSTPRLDAALEGRPHVVKINDWELAEYVCGPVDGPQLAAAAERVRSAGAETVIVTRGSASAVAFTPDGAFEFEQPAFERGHREGCGDAMMGALAVGIERGDSMRDAIALGCAAGAANFLRRGLCSASAQAVQELRPRVSVRDYVDSAPGAASPARRAGSPTAPAPQSPGPPAAGASARR